MRRWQSGQLHETVNLAPSGYEGSNPSLRTKTNFVGNDCSARANARAPQGKIRFCFRRKIPEFAHLKI